MASFSEYQQPIMTCDNDFTLYSYPETWNDPSFLMPAYADQSYAGTTTFDNFSAQQAYAQPDRKQAMFTQSYQSAQNHLRPQSPNYSPSNSASHSLDYQNAPILSSTSDSGASAQSTISSTMGSPSAQACASNDWQQQASMSMVQPSIVQQENVNQDFFAPTGFDVDMIPITNKGCVGESNSISSSQPPQSFPTLSPFSLPPPAQPNGTTSTAMQRPPGFCTASQLSNQPVFVPQPLMTGHLDATSPISSDFKSPDIPAPIVSPVLRRVTGKQQRNGSVASSRNPSLIQPTSPSQLAGTQLHESQPMQPHQQMMYPHPPSPRPAVHSPSFGKAPSPYMRTHAWQPYPAYPGSRRQSISSIHSRHSQGSISSDDSNKGLCPIPTCGRHVKDLKAHMLTHQNERPEKCPIPTCEYHIKGFARKYDKNRHTLTHYKGTMVCGFCPGSGSAAEKSFNRADVFKRHLTSVHGVEQTPPNARRKSPTSTTRKSFGVQDISGMCSTCGNTFANAQDFYEHLDDCVLRVVQQADPSEAINEKLLSSVAEDQQVKDTMDRHMLPNTVDFNASSSFYEEEEAEDEDDGDIDDANDSTYGNRSSKSGKGSLKSRKSGQHVGGGTSHVSSGRAVSKPSTAQRKGMTLSKNGVPLAGAMNSKGSKRRKNYPLSWGAAPEKMKMKKRVLCVFDGARRLWKDDMMLDADHEVRIPLPGVGDGRAWVTDLDVATLQRAEGLHNATEEEKGPWDPCQLLQ
ncbi:hypothetical protein KC340_g12851 [Hortaea werneckii]|nr:hypothetical protein KC342_g13185 [Hortaea werneckii]KAI7072446.1 hypothetical protein KC339_g14311 [Hortaea werneckii]KAI7224943.1 hypothetical protein KC365_g10320 [Hortaea werneckii]KAI7302141.1 hypothetical protein KC340_g12851 [Hortaea werneckii]